MQVIADEKFKQVEDEFRAFCEYLVKTESYQLIANKFNRVYQNLIMSAQEDLVRFFMNQNAKLLNIHVKQLTGKLCVALSVSGEKDMAYRIANQLFID